MRAQRHPPARRQSGAAILMAMLTVVLVATLASAALWQQWRALEVESAERSRMQATWILHGALDWARLILAEDGRKGGSDNLTEPWAIALEPARLSSFIAADRNDTQRIPANGNPGFCILTVRGGWEITKNFGMNVALENLTDEDYRNAGSGSNEAGFGAVVGATVKW